MVNQDKQILNEILLELTLAIGSESNYKKILKNCLPLILRRLNCIAAGIFDIEDNKIVPKFFIPFSFPKSNGFEDVIKSCESLNDSYDYREYLQYSDGKSYFIVFNSNRGSLFMLKRRNKFSKIQINDLIPIVNFLHIALENAIEKEKRLKLQKTLRRLSLVASQSTNGVIITNKKGEVEWINEGFTRLTGFTLEEIEGKKPGTMLQGPNSDPKVIELMRYHLNKEEPFDVEIVNYTKHKKEYWIQVSCNPLYNEQQELQGFMAIESDISERKSSEAKLLQAKKDAENAQEAEKQFLANMSHEIRTPLNAVIGMTALLKDTCPTEEQLDYLNTLNTSANFLLKLISDVLDISKIQAGKIDSRISIFDLHKFLNTIHKTFINRLTNSNVKVVCKIDHTVPQFVKADDVLLMQILNNLMSNAEKFTEHGEIGFEASMKNHEEPNSILNLKVFDSGVGISQNRLDFIFRKFTQLKDKNRADKRGTGLGLAITKELVELLGGNIEVESKLNVGTTFQVSVPVVSVQTESGDARQRDSISLKSNSSNINFEDCLILVAEDNPINQKYIKRIFEKNNINYELANDGQETVNMCKLKKYDLIFMDIQMPIMDGLEACSIIRKSENLNKDTCILALTASALREDEHDALEAGMNGFLTKPFTPIKLLEIMKSNLRKTL